jgi:hypothetical protein
MVPRRIQQWKFLVLALAIGTAGVAMGGVVQPLISTCGRAPADCSVYVCQAGTWVETGGTKPNGTSCDDGNRCTTGDKCAAGVCAGTGPVIDDGNACTADSYSPTTCAVSHTKLTNTCCANGVAITTNLCCTNGTPKTPGSLCNDGNACTRTDTCQAGVCVGSNPVVCTASDQCHDVGVCNTTTGACSNPPNTGRQCSDGNACTRTDTCQAGVCVGSNPVVCPTPDECHMSGTCNPGTGICSNPQRPIGTACGDQSSCGCSAAAACVFTVDRTNYCYDPSGNQTGQIVRSAGAACFTFQCP